MSIDRLILADDLSGAIDSAACFAGDCKRVRAYFDVGRVRPSEAVSVDLGTRDRTSRDIRSALGSAEHLIAAAALTFKKVDSLLRGPWAEELSYLMESGRFDLCVFAPALPRHGRLTVGGRQLVRRAEGHLEEVSGDLRSALRADPRIAVCDAVTDRNLKAIVRWGRGLQGNILWCGSAGLAQALADTKPPMANQLRIPLLAIYGTQNPVSVRQLEYADGRGLKRRIVADAAAAAQAALISDDLRRFGHCIVSFALAANLSASSAGEILARRLGELLPLIQKPGTLIVTGGETLYSACGAAAVDHIEVRAQFAVGIPQSALQGGAWNGVALISKSGGFGSPQWLAELFLKALRSTVPV